MTTATATTAEGEQGARRALPVGWGWRAAVGIRGVWFLYAPGVDGLDKQSATAHDDGLWRVYQTPEAGLSFDGGHEVASVDEPALDAAQAAAEAALWRVDGFGVGEVRGLVLGDEWAMPVGFALDAPRPSPMALPGLPGMWTLTRVSSARPLTVDAVRAPVAEPAPLPSLWSVAAEMQGDPAPREPSAPTPAASDELAALLPSPDRVAWLLHPVSSTGRETIAASQYEELRIEAVRLRAKIATLDDLVSTENEARHRSQTEARALRARVAELEAAHESASRFERRTAESLLARVAELEAANEGLAQIVNDRSATPPGASVAALLASLDGARKASELGAQAEEDRTVPDLAAIGYDRGRGRGLQDAARLITATLTPPSPIDRAAAEVCALPPFTGTLSDAFDRIGEALDLVGDESTPKGTRRALAKVARVALAGMLACDAAPVPEEPTR